MAEPSPKSSKKAEVSVEQPEKKPEDAFISKMAQYSKELATRLSELPPKTRQRILYKVIADVFKQFRVIEKSVEKTPEMLKSKERLTLERLNKERAGALEEAIKKIKTLVEGAASAGKPFEDYAREAYDLPEEGAQIGVGIEEGTLRPMGPENEVLGLQDEYYAALNHALKAIEDVGK